MSAASRPQQPQPGADPDGGALVLCGARLADGRAVDVRLGGGRIQAVGTAGSLAPGTGGPVSGTADSPGPGTGSNPGHGSAPGARGGSASRTVGAPVDLTGYLLLPSPAEPHAHCDTALTAQGPADAVPGGRASRAERADVQRRTTEAVLLQLGHGATAVRTHVRVGAEPGPDTVDCVEGPGAPDGLNALEAVLAARTALRGLADVAVVAMPRLLTGAAGADGRAMLRDALEMGATAVGGCPDLDADPARHTETVLRTAADHGCAVDLHTDGADPAHLARLAAMAADLGPDVTIGPCGALGGLPPEAAARAADGLAAAGVSVVCVPQGPCGAAAGAGGGIAPGVGPRGAGAFRHAPVRLLRAAGVRVAAGSGAVRDVANPVGRGDPLQTAYLLAAWREADPAEAYAMVAAHARAVLGMPEVRVEAGFPAELLAVRGDDMAGVLSLAYSRIVIHRGRVVARTSAVREYCDSGTAGTAVTVPSGRLPAAGS